METAKANIEHWYPVVGILEDLQMTLFVLENKLPLFFKGASNIYFNELKGMQNILSSNYMIYRTLAIIRRTYIEF